MKRCFKCGVEKPLDEFYRHKGMSDGRLGKCKTCTRSDVTARTRFLSENDPEWLVRERIRSRDKNRKLRDLGITYKPDPVKVEARTKLNNAIRSGAITRELCAVCGKEAQGHHEDYSKPYDVIWLCPRHHQLRHAYLNRCYAESVEPLPFPAPFSIVR